VDAAVSVKVPSVAAAGCLGREPRLALSTSVMLSHDRGAQCEGVRRRALSSLTYPGCSADHRNVVGAVMVTVTAGGRAPSKETAVKLSVSDWPAPSCWIAVCVLSEA